MTRADGSCTLRTRLYALPTPQPLPRRVYSGSGEPAILQPVHIAECYIEDRTRSRATTDIPSRPRHRLDRISIAFFRPALKTLALHSAILRFGSMPWLLFVKIALFSNVSTDFSSMILGLKKASGFR